MSDYPPMPGSMALQTYFRILGFVSEFPDIPFHILTPGIALMNTPIQPVSEWTAPDTNPYVYSLSPYIQPNDWNSDAMLIPRMVQMGLILHAQERYQIIEANGLYPHGIVCQQLAQQVNVPFILRLGVSDIVRILPEHRDYYNWIIKQAAKIDVYEPWKARLRTLGVSADRMIARDWGIQFDPAWFTHHLSSSDARDLEEDSRRIDPEIMVVGSHLGKDAGTSYILNNFAAWKREEKLGVLAFYSTETHRRYYQRMADHLGVNDAIRWNSILPPDTLIQRMQSASAVIYGGTYAPMEDSASIYIRLAMLSGKKPYAPRFLFRYSLNQGYESHCWVFNDEDPHGLMEVWKSHHPTDYRLQTQQGNKCQKWAGKQEQPKKQWEYDRHVLALDV